MNTTISLPSASPFASLANLREAIEASTRPDFLAGRVRGARRPVLVAAMLAVSATTLVCAFAGRGDSSLIGRLQSNRAVAVLQALPQAGHAIDDAAQWWGAAPTPSTPRGPETIVAQEAAIPGPARQEAQIATPTATLRPAPVAAATLPAPSDSAPPPPASQPEAVAQAPDVDATSVMVPANVPLPPPSPVALANAIEGGVPLPPPRPGFRSVAPPIEAASSVAPATPGHDVAPAAPPSVQVASAPADTRGFLEKFFSIGKPTGALGYAASEDGALSGTADRFTAVYDIAAHTVTLPDGSKLEAHSGLGAFQDDPSHANARMRGVTPPHIYDLSLRESSFHGVQAIRLNPVGGEGHIYGRVGLLAHPYMLGPNGASNGCVSFRDYNAFLQAFRNGQIRRLLVVAHSA